MQETNENIDRTIELSRHLLHSTDFADYECEDDRCRVFYRTVRNRANQIIKEAERERRRKFSRDLSETRKKPAPALEGLKTRSSHLWKSVKNILKKSKQ